MWVGGRTAEVFLTRLHVRYDRDHFPEDLQFQETGDRANFQARYVLRHSWSGSDSCPAADDYRRALPKRQQDEVRELARLTGWDEGDIAKKARVNFTAGSGDDTEWWKKIWPKS
jgi:hypothetical protein